MDLDNVEVEIVCLNFFSDSLFRDFACVDAKCTIFGV